MADVSLDAVRKEFADLTGLFEDAAAIASVGQGINSVQDGRRQLKLTAKMLDRITFRLNRLERRLA